MTELGRPESIRWITDSEHVRVKRMYAVGAARFRRRYGNLHGPRDANLALLWSVVNDGIWDYVSEQLGVRSLARAQELMVRVSDHADLVSKSNSHTTRPARISRPESVRSTCSVVVVRALGGTDDKSSRSPRMTLTPSSDIRAETVEREAIFE